MFSYNLPNINVSSDLLIQIAVPLILAILILSLIFFILRAIFINIKERILIYKGLGLAYFEVKLPNANEVEIKAAEQMFTGLVGIGDKPNYFKDLFKVKKFVSFEIVAFKESIKFYIACPKSIASVIDRQINGTYPLAEITRIKEYNLFPAEGYTAYAKLNLDKDTKIPIATFDEMPVDTISTITDTFSKLQDDEAAVFQMVISPAGSEWRNKSKEYVKTLREPEKDEEGKPKTNSKPKYNDDTISLMEKKAEKSGFYTDIRIVVTSTNKESADSHLTNILSTFDQYLKEAGNRFKRMKEKKMKRIVEEFVYRIPRETMILNTAELATLFHFPNKNVKTPHIKWLLAKKAPAPDFVPSKFDENYMYIGRNMYRGQVKEIFIKPEDRLRHFYVIGQTGTGKSGFMGGMMIRDMKLGHGCGYIDPHGSDAEKILQQVPPERIEDVIIFDPSDLERPIGLNMLEFHSQAQRTLVTNEMLNIFDSLYDLKATGGPIFEQYMRYAVMLLTEDIESGSTLLEIPKIFTDQAYRDYKLSKCKDQEVIDFWRKQAEQAGGEASLKNIVPYVVSKFTSFLSNQYVRPIIAQQESSINFRKLMDEEKILIVRLSKGKIGDFNSNLLGMILIGKILIAALEREGTPEKDRKAFYLYIDEFQNFLTDGIMIILSEARKYKLALTIGHQFIGQLTRSGGNTKIRDAIFGNVGNKAILRVGEDDAAFLKKVVGEGFEENDLQQIENYNYYIKMLVDGRPTPAFTSRSFYGDSPYDMITKGSEELADITRQISRLKYGKDRNVIESEVKMRSSFIKEKTEAEKKSSMGDFGGFGKF